MVKYMIDCDTGIDDALALAVLTKLINNDLLAVISSYGMAPLKYVQRNNQFILNWLNRQEVAVYPGASLPLKRKRIYSGHFHGMDGLGNLLGEKDLINRTYSNQALEKIHQLIHQYPHKIVWIVTGPLTNAALLFQKYPNDGHLLKRMVIMGGAFISEGNVNQYAEANIYIDPEAADFVFQAAVKKVLVPLDVTRKIILTHEKVTAWQHSANKTLQIYAQFVGFYLQAYKKFHPYLAGCALHDPLAAAIAVYPDLVVNYLKLNVKVNLDQGDSLGRTTENLAKDSLITDTKLVLAVEVKRFEKLFDTIMASM